jgi:dienelactone hydrolase
MSSDELAAPLSGTAAGVPYFALPPTAVDSSGDGPVPLIVCWHGFDPPRTERACAAALSLTGVPAWRVFLGLPMFGRRLPAGGLDELRVRDYLVDLLVPIAEQAVHELPAVVDELRHVLGRRPAGVDDGPIGLLGLAEGGTAALLALAEGVVPVSAAALVGPVAVPTRAVAALERRFGAPYRWTTAGRELADLLDFTLRAAEIARDDPAILLVAGQDDDLVSPTDTALLRDALSACGAERVEYATFRMGHALMPEPGLDPVPPTAEAVSVDSALTDWFRHRLTAVAASARGAAHRR